MDRDIAIKEIRRYNKENLKQFWTIIKNQRELFRNEFPEQWPNPVLVDGIVKHDFTKQPKWKNGQAFEYMLLRLFELENARVTYPYGKIQGIDGCFQETDGVIYTKRVNILVESKDLTSSINSKVVAKLSDRLEHRNQQMIGCIFSARSPYTEKTIDVSFYTQKYHSILLWWSDEIDYLINYNKSFLAALSLKYKYLVERLNPYFNTMIIGSQLNEHLNNK